MYLVKDISSAIGLMAVALVLLGTWPVVLAVLERRGRLPQHTFLDFSVTNFLAAVLIALTFGQIGAGEPDFFAQLSQVSDEQLLLFLITDEWSGTRSSVLKSD